MTQCLPLANDYKGATSQGVLPANTGGIADDTLSSPNNNEKGGNDNTSVVESGNQWAEQLTTTQRSALRDYTDTSYSNINSSLRGKSRFSAGNVEKATAIHQALSKATIPCACTVYRGASNAALGYLQNLSDDELVGHVIRDGGFLSTTLQPDSPFMGNVQFEISVPAGAHGAYIGSLSCFPDEDEVLFDAQQHLTITGVRRGKYGERIISARMLV